MGYDILVAVCFVVMTPVVIAGFIVFWTVNHRDHEELASAWRLYAKKRGLDFVPPEGDWPNRTSPAVEWTEGDAELRLSLIGKEARVRTRLVMRPRSALLGTATLLLDEHGSFVTVRQHPPRFGERIANDSVVRGLHSLHQRDRITVSYRRGRVTMEWPGGEQNEHRLDAARQVARELACTIESEFRAPSRMERKAS